MTGRDKKPRPRAGEVTARVTRRPPRTSGSFAKVEIPAHTAIPLGPMHDLRNLVYVISACAEAATRDVAPGTNAYENLTDIRAAAVRAAKLVDALAPAATPEVGSIDVNVVLADFLPILRRQAGSRARVVLEPGAGPLRATIDPHALEHVLLNLVVNAVDGITEAGIVTLRTQALDEGVRIVVADDGSGMDAATLARAFDVRFTTRAAIGRRGMGLSTVRRLVEAVGGNVSLTSTPGAGTEVTIELRAVPARASLPPRFTP